ncbi:hypothetical protein AB0945_08180 [Streptomyces sp. NPDC005474]
MRRQALSRGVVVAAAAMSLLSLYGVSTLADADAGKTTKGAPGAV